LRKGKGKYLYSSLIPYAITISGCSVITALAAAFMRSNARRSFGFSNACLAENLSFIRDFYRLDRGGLDILVEASSIDADHDPGVGEENIWLFKGLDIFVSVNVRFHLI
jgi:hypothetical protein